MSIAMRLKMSISKYQKSPRKYYLPYLLTEEKNQETAFVKKKSTNTLLRKKYVLLHNTYIR